MNDKLKTTLVIVSTLILAGIAIFSAIFLYQQGQTPVAPTAPESQPAAQQELDFDSCSDLSFAVATVEDEPSPPPPTTTVPPPTTTTTAPTSTPISVGDGTGPAAPPSCNATAPGSAPTITSAVGGTNSVTLTWTKAANPVTHYFIVYGRSPGAEEYGATNIGNANTTTFTVESLSGGTTYYFRIAAVNSCMPGKYSNEISARPSGGTLAGPAKGFSQLEKETQELPVAGVNFPTIAFSLAGITLVLLGLILPLRRRA